MRHSVLDMESPVNKGISAFAKMTFSPKLPIFFTSLTSLNPLFSLLLKKNHFFFEEIAIRIKINAIFAAYEFYT